MINEIMIDTILDDSSYDNVSFSNKHDILDMLESYDIIFNQALDGNENALCVIEDFTDLLFGKNGQANCKMVIKYIKVKTGVVSIDTKGKECKNIIEELAVDEGKWVRTINKIIDEEIDIIIERNKANWKRVIQNKYGTTDFSDYECSIKSESLFSCDNDKELWDLDYKIKYGHEKVCKKIKGDKIENGHESDEDYPQELKDLEFMYELNEKRLVELRAIKERGQEEQKELNKLIKLNKDFLSDIKDIKDYYGIVYEEYKRTDNFTDHRGTLSFEDSMYSTEVKKLGSSDFNLESDSIKIDKIMDVAEAVLTDRQFVLFELYFRQGLKQKEISRLTGVKQGHISRDLNISINKIKNNLINL